MSNTLSSTGKTVWHGGVGQYKHAPITTPHFTSTVHRSAVSDFTDNKKAQSVLVHNLQMNLVKFWLRGSTKKTKTLLTKLKHRCRQSASPMCLPVLHSTTCGIITRNVLVIYLVETLSLTNASLEKALKDASRTEPILVFFTHLTLCYPTQPQSHIKTKHMLHGICFPEQCRWKCRLCVLAHIL